MPQQIRVNLPNDVYDALNDYKAKHGGDISSICTTALRQYLTPDTTQMEGLALSHDIAAGQLRYLVAVVTRLAEKQGVDERVIAQLLDGETVPGREGSGGVPLGAVEVPTAADSPPANPWQPFEEWQQRPEAPPAPEKPSGFLSLFRRTSE